MIWGLNLGVLTGRNINEIYFAASVFPSTVPCPEWISRKQPVIANFIITFGQMSLECNY